MPCFFSNCKLTLSLFQNLYFLLAWGQFFYFLTLFDPIPNKQEEGRDQMISGTLLGRTYCIKGAWLYGDIYLLPDTIT